MLSDNDEEYAEARSWPSWFATASDPKLNPLESRGGEQVIYHGWNDPAISALNSVNYFESVRTKLRAKATDSFLRLYIVVPKMLHGRGGPGPDEFGQAGNFTDVDSGDNMRLSPQRRTESGASPSVIIASKHDRADSQHVTMTRPLCPYPQAAKYKGTGDTTNAANFVCTEK